MKDEFERVVKPEDTEILEIEQVPLTPKKPHKAENGVVVDGVEGCQVKFAKCCNPLPGDPIVGFVTKGFGISIHRADCKNIVKNMGRNEDRERYKTAHWEEASLAPARNVFEAMLQIRAVQSLTLIADMTAALADMRISVLQINSCLLYTSHANVFQMRTYI